MLPLCFWFCYCLSVLLNTNALYCFDVAMDSKRMMARMQQVNEEARNAGKIVPRIINEHVSKKRSGDGQEASSKKQKVAPSDGVQEAGGEGGSLLRSRIFLGRRRLLCVPRLARMEGFSAASVG